MCADHGETDPGRRAEDRACRYLRRHGYRIVQRNWRCRLGELDIIARDGDVLAVVEVKLRRSGAFGGPEGALSPMQCRRIRAATGVFLAATACDLPVRFDLVAIDGVEVRLHRDAFRADGCSRGF
ncbi:MAG: YraN family protein [Candidatus Bipolaricaulota bacterium]|nr:MAG: YraN family protein [Candidatus Bipolaricaulota bacterium]